MRRRGSVAPWLRAVLLCSLLQLRACGRYVHTGRELAAAIADPTVADVYIGVPFLNLTDSDWEGVQPLPVPLSRNLTLTGAPELPEWPLLVLWSTRKVLLQDGGRLVLHNLLLYRYRRANGFQPPGTDMLVPSPPGPPGGAAVFDNSVLVLDFCEESTVMAINYAAARRPRSMPGSQVVRVNVPQPGCVNVSAQAADANRLTTTFRQRCCASTDAVDDLAIGAADLDNRNGISSSNYFFLVNYSRTCCQLVLPETCRTEYGGSMECWAHVLSLRGNNSDDRNLYYMHGDLFPAWAADAGGLVNASMQPLPPPGQGGGGGDDSSVVPLAVGIGMGVGGAVLLAAMGLAAVVWRRQRGGRTAGGGGRLTLSKDTPLGEPTTAIWMGDDPSPDSGPAKAPSAAAGGSAAGGAESGGDLTGLACKQDPAAGLDTGLSDLPSSYGKRTPPASAAMVCSSSDTSSLPITERTPFKDGLDTKANLVLPYADALDGPAAGLDWAWPSAYQAHASQGPEPHSLGSIAYVETPPRGTASGPAPAFGPASGPGPVPGPGVGLESGPQSGISSQRQGQGGDTVTLLPGPPLGKGGFAAVYAGSYKGEAVAVKILRRGQEGVPEHSADVRATLVQELEILARCRHPNVVRLLAACLDPPRPFMVLEKMETSLDKLLYGKGPGELLPLGLVLTIASEIARGLEYLHPTILHRDLKPANVLISDPWGFKPVVKLSDFGLSRLRATVLCTQNPEAGTAPYTAPECFEIGNHFVTHKADIWSFGTLLWECLAGEVPWKGLPAVQIAVQITLKNYRLKLPPRTTPGGTDPHRWPPRLLRLLADCLDTDPLRRPAAAEVVKRLALVQEAMHLHAMRPDA
ncbi:hypothetical protein HYH03_005076 [Edaphochlamys debaryana]|uniref:Protein kinase domain-containing protein n=1 Tax=Edaphochlamys debaryana TaxID=47281 RepID=A0A836C2R4_9CHLO|nr:hypothetical protein HYH03_005076 [Edaphochlamys debaryana]|eukprot:KAG2497082.1 hypothetical protein HYH03_005076 [Edaphochlamys debaryana]